MESTNFKEVLFSSCFPNKGETDTYTVFIYGIGPNKHHYLLWSPLVSRLDTEIEAKSDDWNYKKTVKINGTVYICDEGYYFKIIDLDYKKEISKSDIEKMFGCEVVNK